MRLHDKALDALSYLIVGDSGKGPLYRSGNALWEFFNIAGLNPPDFEGGRRAWTLEQLRRYNNDPESMRRVIERLADPREYIGEPGAIHETISRLNEILALDGFHVELDDTTPKIDLVTSYVPQAPNPQPHRMAAPEFIQVTNDPVLLQILQTRWDEAVSSVQHGSYLSAVIMLGSILEGVLLAVAKDHPKEVNQAKSAPRDATTGAVKKFGEWTLQEFIDVAHELGWIQRDVKTFSHALRDYRNLVHPHKQAQTADRPDDGTARISLQVTQEAVSDIIDYLT